MIWNAEGFGCVPVLIKLVVKIKYVLNMTGSNKKGIEVEKRQKTYFFIQSSFCLLFVKRYIFGYLQRGAVIAAVNLI